MSKQREVKKPVTTFRAGQISASIWAKEETVNKKQLTFYNTTIVKSYMDDKEEWKQTSSFNREDLVKVVLVTQKAIEFIYLKKEE